MNIINLYKWLPITSDSDDDGVPNTNNNDDWGTYYLIIPTDDLSSKAIAFAKALNGATEITDATATSILQSVH